MSVQGIAQDWQESGHFERSSPPANLPPAAFNQLLCWRKGGCLEGWCSSSQVAVTCDGALVRWRCWTLTLPWEAANSFLALLFLHAHLLFSQLNSFQESSPFYLSSSLPNPADRAVREWLGGLWLLTGVKPRQAKASALPLTLLAERGYRNQIPQGNLGGDFAAHEIRSGFHLACDKSRHNRQFL